MPIIVKSFKVGDMVKVTDRMLSAYGKEFEITDIMRWTTSDGIERLAYNTKLHGSYLYHEIEHVVDDASPIVQFLRSMQWTR